LRGIFVFSGGEARALAPFSGIETIANFTLGRDELNIDLGALLFHDTTVSEILAVAIMSCADPGHGLVR
jgi:hypothetical protein